MPIRLRDTDAVPASGRGAAPLRCRTPLCFRVRFDARFCAMSSNLMGTACPPAGVSVPPAVSAGPFQLTGARVFAQEGLGP
ncbi:hypothetical protein SCMC78_71020 [Streptomyces sp. CMC78]|uniref:Uncharacterized protein n=1 Tax=Streptomyces sp. CMC78 TaxID=3231512 RepID=A0AB33KZV8_9ACTN